MITKKIQNQLNKIWTKIGLIIQLSQMIEYNLANIVAGNEILKEFIERDSMSILEYNDLAEESNKWLKILLKSTMGGILTRANAVKYFNEKSAKLLEEVLTRRNYIAHQLFVDDLKNKYLETNPLHYYDYLEETINLMYEINNSLVDIDKKQRLELKTIY